MLMFVLSLSACTKEAPAPQEDEHSTFRPAGVDVVERPAALKTDEPAPTKPAAAKPLEARAEPEALEVVAEVVAAQAQAAPTAEPSADAPAEEAPHRISPEDQERILRKHGAFGQLHRERRRGDGIESMRHERIRVEGFEGRRGRFERMDGDSLNPETRRRMRHLRGVQENGAASP
jgi:hypothetical protein